MKQIISNASQFRDAFRAAIVGFPAHGSRHRVINMRLAA